MSIAWPKPVPGCTYFLTVRLRDADSDLLICNIDLLRLSVRLCQQQLPFTIADAVVLPDRIHMIWELPPGDADLGARLRMIKTTFARHLPRAAAHSDDGAASGIWQRRYWEHPIHDPLDYSECAALIAAAPVAAGLVKHSADWPYSTVARRGGRQADLSMSMR